jgi:O-methyltransferase involved in polyketide biosynthesis
MPGLKAGHVQDFSNSMAEAIETAMQQELALSGTSLPAAGQDDRRLLFVAIARGVLQYLKDHQSETLRSITLNTPALSGVAPVDSVDLNYSGS